MILVFFILLIIISICIISLILLLLNLKIKIENFKIVSDKEKIKIDFLIVFSIYFLNKINIFNIKLDKEKIKNKIDLKKVSKNGKENINILKKIKKLNYKIEYLKIEGQFGTFNLGLSNNIFIIIQSIIPIIISRKLDGKYINNLKILNNNENTINVIIDCIISTKFVNIINILHLNSKAKKGGIEKNGRTSNRRINAYSNE